MAHNSRDNDETANIRDTVIDAATQVVLMIGWQRLTMADVAKKSGIGRATLYRHFATKDELLRAVTEKEVTGFVSSLHAVRTAAPDLESAMLAGFLYSVNGVMNNAIIAKLRETDREVLTNALFSTETIRIATESCAQMWRELLFGAREVSDTELARIETVSEVNVRLTLSLAVNPNTISDITSEQGSEVFVRSFFAAFLRTI